MESASASRAWLFLLLLILLLGIFFQLSNGRESSQLSSSENTLSRYVQATELHKNHGFREQSLRIGESRTDLNQSRAFSTISAVPTFEELSSQADAGNVRAACMLGMLLETCDAKSQSTELRNVFLDRAAEALPGSETERTLATRVELIDNALQRFEYLCASLSPDEKAQEFERMLQAVKLGSSRAAVRFFLQPQIKTKLGAISLTRAAQYEHHAIEGLQQASLKGNGQAMFNLFELLSAGSMQNSDVELTTRIDRGKAIALGRTISPFLDPPTFAATQKTLFSLQKSASIDELKQADVWQSKLRVIPDSVSPDGGLPDPSEEIERCIEE